MEPTDNALHAGCLGNINATWTFRGVARPLGAPVAGRQRDPPRRRAGIAALAERRARRATTFDGPALPRGRRRSPVAAASRATSIPDECVAEVNYRYAPGARAADAEARAARAVRAARRAARSTRNAPSGAGAGGQRRSWSGSSRPATWRSRPSRRGRRWPSSRAAGVDAVNFGPGDPRYAHRRDEQVAVAALVRSYAMLEALPCA